MPFNFNFGQIFIYIVIKGNIKLNPYSLITSSCLKMKNLLNIVFSNFTPFGH